MQLNHKNLLKVVDYFYNSDALYIVSEYCNKGDLTTYLSTIRKNPEANLNNSKLDYQEEKQAIIHTHRSNMSRNTHAKAKTLGLLM